MFTSDNLVGGCGLPREGHCSDGAQTSDTNYKFETGDFLGVAFDTETGDLWFSINGSWVSGNPSTLTSPTTSIPDGTYHFKAMFHRCGAVGDISWRIFPTGDSQTYPLPTGFTSYQPEA